MKSYRDSDIFKIMDKNDAITNGIKQTVKNIMSDKDTILNKHLSRSLAILKKERKETIVLKLIEAIENNEIIIAKPRVDSLLPARIPFVKANIEGKIRVIVDVTNYVKVTTNDLGKIIDVEIPASKLYSMLVPAFISLKLMNPSDSLTSESIKYMSAMWAKLFSKVLSAKKVFINSTDKYQGYMYFAMKFFMRYYLETPEVLADKIAMAYIGGKKSPFITKVEEHCSYTGIELYKDFKTFSMTMFSNEVTGIVMDKKMNLLTFLMTFDQYLGRDGAYLSLWSADYFLYCCMVTYNKEYILNDRAWEDVVLKDGNIMSKLLVSLYREI